MKMDEERILKNIPVKKPVFLKDMIAIQTGSIVSKIIVQNDQVSLTLFSFGQGQEISAHQSDGDALVTILEGSGTFVIDGAPYVLQEGESILMPRHHTHAVKATADFKMLLNVVF